MVDGPTSPENLDLAQQCSTTLQARFYDMFALARAGIVRPDSEMRNFFTEISGTSFRIRQWTRISGRAQADDGTDTTFKTFASEGENAVVCRRKVGIEVFQATVDAGGPSASVDGAVANQTPIFWAREAQSTHLDILKGLFTPSTGILSASHAVNISKAAGVPQRATRAGVRAAKAKMGDAARFLTVGIMNSAQLEDLKAEHYQQNPTVPFPMEDYEGLNLLQDDGIEPISGEGAFAVYPIYILAPGSLGLMMQNSMHVDRVFNSKHNSYETVQSMALVPHVFGVTFTGSDTFVKPDWGPVYTELQNAGNWAKRTGVETKDIQITALLANRSAA